MTDRELMQQALDGLIEAGGYCGNLITALRERLAQPEQEPVCDKDPQGCWNVRCQLGKVCKNTPPRREWVGLTEEEIEELDDHTRRATIDNGTPVGWFAAELARAIEAKLKEKNA